MQITTSTDYIASIHTDDNTNTQKTRAKTRQHKQRWEENTRPNHLCIEFCQNWLLDYKNVPPKIHRFFTAWQARRAPLSNKKNPSILDLVLIILVEDLNRVLIRTKINAKVLVTIYLVVSTYSI